MSLMKIALSTILPVLLVVSALHADQESPIISYRDGRLIYHPDDRGNRVPDFSHCGYAGGDYPIPEAPVRMVVAPVEKYSTERIQNAIDYVAGLPEDGNWMLREAGKQLLAYLGNDAELDLSDESGTFRANTVNALTGSVTAGEIISAGTDVTLPPSTVVWLTKE